MQAVARHMIDRGISGRIINMASQAGRRGEPLVAVYCATKAAVISLTQSAGLNLIRHGINVNAIAPGVVDGEHWDGVDAFFAKYENKAPRPEEEGSRFEAVPYGRMGRAEDLTGMAIFLASAGGRLHRRPVLQRGWRTVDELTPLPLSEANLAGLPETVDRPRYDRRALRPGIVHIGLGNFHRAHQAWYLHRLMQAGAAADWAILGAGVRPYDAGMRSKLLAQNCLTTLIELDPGGTSAEVTGAMTDYLPVEEGHGALIGALSDPAIRIVSLTVTEGGYYLDPASGGFDADHPDIAYDAANPDRPRTAFGAIVAALKARRDAGVVPLTGQSCDNLQGNGHILRQTVVSLARLSDPGLADWIDDACSFPNSMVDCIVPATGPAEIALARRFGIDDAAPVTHENFRQWVIEDAFCAGRPDWEEVGVTFTDDVHAYEAMKIRILNAGHQVIANPGEILGLETIADCMAHAEIRAFFDKIQTTEITPHVAPVPGTTPTDYAKLIARRFANPEIKDTVRRVAFDGSSRHTGFVLPILRDALAAGAPISGLCLVEALWARMCAGVREDGSEIAPNDPQWDSLAATAHAAKDRPQTWLEQTHLYGDLHSMEPFSTTFAEWLRTIWDVGTVAALRRYLGYSVSP